MSEMKPNLRIALMKKVDEIDEILLESVKDIGSNYYDLSLAAGVSGISLYFFYKYKITAKKKFLNAAHKLLDVACDDPFQNTMTSYCSGYAGLGWLIQHLSKNDIIDVNSEELLTSLDQMLMPIMIKHLKTGNYDFLHGALGISYYFLSRNIKNQKSILDFLTTQLDEIAISDNNYYKWKDFDHKENTVVDNKYNFGLSHGMPSIITMLAKLYALDNDNQLAKTMSEKGAYFIMDSKIQKKADSLYSYSYTDFNDLENNRSSRLGWCYGDLGIALCLWNAGKNLSSKIFKSQAIEIMDRSSARKITSNTGVIDAGMCHGTSGVSHIFRHFYWETGNPTYLNSSNYWLEQTLNEARFGDGLAGYKSFNSVNGENTWVKSYGLLDGISGIGLALSTAIYNKPLSWDEWLLIS